MFHVKHFHLERLRKDMTRNEHTNIIQQLLGMVSAENQATASSLLTQLSDDYEQTLTNSETLTTENKRLTTNNESLREVNASLFLKVGQTNKETHNDNKEKEKPNIKEENELTFDKLFGEKGELL